MVDISNLNKKFEPIDNKIIKNFIETNKLSISIRKKIIDYIGSAVILLLLAPLMLLIALAIKYDSKGPVFFKQRRNGKNNKEIIIYKFRSMIWIKDEIQIVQAIENDQRFTKIGKFLRKTSFDELPQFINVLQGRMSIVGPRPHAIAHNDYYKQCIENYMDRQQVKPGITGWAQVNGYRGETNQIIKMKNRVDYDRYYIENWSLKFDISIIIKTIILVIKDIKDIKEN
ncbi:MAG: exopolysaccharide biosynthesis polyprenyl glycosylphosphotransferase [Polaromonas sp.]|nr:exopolysaccharide biosynthesis polyprenyl glycosylphosphotransferase [Polaromonas sp.]